MGRPFESVFAGEWRFRNPLNAPRKGVEAVPAGRMRWSVWGRGMGGEMLVRWVRDEVFPFYAGIGDRLGAGGGGEGGAAGFMANARLVVDEPTVLTQVVNKVDGLGLERADADTKGDLFEHVLRQVKQAGELGQFRTPRHVIRAIVAMVDPVKGEAVYDPAAGTAGFLVAAYDHVRLANSSPSGIHEAEVDGKTLRRGVGDRLSGREWDRLRSGTFFGNDVDPKMVSLATMNLALRGLADVRIMRRNVLTTTLERSERAALGLPLGGYAVVLANPPFSGRVDKDRIVDEVKVGTTAATEILFLKHMLDSIAAPAGRCGVIVPEGVLFGSTGAHKELRRMLVEGNRVEAVLSLPGGVFQPYSGVKTSVLLFARGGGRSGCCSCTRTRTATGWTRTTTRRSRRTTCRGWWRPTGRAGRAGRSGGGGRRRRSGRASGGSRRRTSCGGGLEPVGEQVAAAGAGSGGAPGPAGIVG